MQHSTQTNDSFPNTWDTIRRITVALSVGFYLIACALPCLQTPSEDIRGIYCLSLGWLSIVSDRVAFAIWSSNLLFFTALFPLFANKLHGLSLSLNLIATALAYFMYLKGSITGDIETPILKFHIGYYLWAGSYLFASLAALIGRLTQNTTYYNKV